MPSVLALNEQRFSHHSNKLFAPWDFSACPLPKFVLKGDHDVRSFELAHVRDVIQHMPIDAGMRAMMHVLTSGCKYLVATTFPAGKHTSEPTSGGFFMNNFGKPPFSQLLHKPLRCVQTHPGIEPDDTCLYRCDKIKAEAGFREWEQEQKQVNGGG